MTTCNVTGGAIISVTSREKLTTSSEPDAPACVAQMFVAERTEA